jgi:toxin ParE1/3/4
MRKIDIRPRARLDILEIWHHIAADSIEAANKVELAIEKDIRGLAWMPGKGHTRAAVSIEGYRFWTVYSYVIAYRYDDKTLTVVRVIHGRRDFRRIFKNEPRE